MKEQMTAEAAPVMIPKASLPDCAVGETLKIVGEEGDNFLVEPEYQASDTDHVNAEAPAGNGKMGEMMRGHAPAVAIVISGGKGGKPGKS